MFFVFAAISFFTLLGHDGFGFESDEEQKWYKGAWANQAESWFEDNLKVRDFAISGWGMLRYGIFKTGNEGAVIGKDGWLFTKEEFEHINEAQSSEAKKLWMIESIHNLFEEKNIKLLIALIPAKARVYSEYLGYHELPEYRDNLYLKYHKELLEIMDYTPDLSILMNERKQASQIFMKTDTHWTPEGANMVAHHLANIAKNAELLDDIEHNDYITLASEREKYYGDIAKFVPTGCARDFIGPEPDYFSRHNTQKVAVTNNEEDLADALFADEYIPIVLVGTSYSHDEKWNFAGALREAFRADVLNVAMEGKGPIIPMIEWLEKADLDNNPPKLVIWEIPERFIPVDYEIDIRDMPWERTCKDNISLPLPMALKSGDKKGSVINNWHKGEQG